MDAPNALATLAARLTGLLVTIATPLGLLWLGWGVLKGMVAGGTDRALQQLLTRGLIVAVMVIMLENLPATFGALLLLANALFQTVVQAIQGAF